MNRNVFLHCIALVLSVLILSSCEKLGEKKPSSNNVYLKSYEYIRNISELEVEYNLNILTNLYPDAATIKEKATLGVNIYTITYQTSFQGKEIMASGLVSVPIGDGPFPFMSFQNGTNTLHDKAPSKDPNGELFLALETIASTGFVIAIPDYLGFGVSDTMFHPYLDKESTVQTVMDMLNATKELVNRDNLDVNTSDDLYISGYSMGGWATLQLQKELETEPSPDFNLKASACGAGPYNLLFINRYILDQSTYPMPYFIGYMLDSYKQLGYITNSLSDILNEPYASLIPSLFNGVNDGAAINSQLTTNVSGLFTEEYQDGFNSAPAYSSVRSALVNNSIDAWDIATPLMLFHGGEDTFVPYQVSRNMYDDMIELGVSTDKVQLAGLPGGGHQEGILPFGIASVLWFIDIK